MKRTLISSLAFAFVLSTAQAGERWLHVRVDGDADSERVRVTFPLRFAEGILAGIDTTDLTRGRLDLGGDADLDGFDVRAILAAVRDAPDSEFVTVRSEHDSVRVAKERGLLVVHIDEDGGDRVRIRVPLEVVDAALRGPRDQLDLAAGLRALSDYGDIDLLQVDGKDERVRIWIDSKDTGD